MRTLPLPEKIVLDDLVLMAGPHRTRAEGVCVREAVAWYAGEPHSAAASCEDPVLGLAAMQLNDRWNDHDRQKLVAIVPVLAGSRGDWPLSQHRSYFVTDRVVRAVLPAFLRQRFMRLSWWARHFEELPPITDEASLSRVIVLIQELRQATIRSLMSHDDLSLIYLITDDLMPACRTWFAASGSQALNRAVIRATKIARASTQANRFVTNADAMIQVIKDAAALTLESP